MPCNIWECAKALIKLRFLKHIFHQETGDGDGKTLTAFMVLNIRKLFMWIFIVNF